MCVCVCDIFIYILKWYAVLLGNHAGSSNTKISEYLGVNLKTVQKI